MAFAGDPYSAQAFKELCGELGAGLDMLFVCGRKDRTFPELERGAVFCEYAAPKARLQAVLSGAGGEARRDLVIGNSSALVLYPEGPVLEFGVPSLVRHSVASVPYYGFQGAASLAERMAKELLGAELDLLRGRRRLTL